MLISFLMTTIPGASGKNNDFMGRESRDVPNLRLISCLKTNESVNHFRSSLVVGHIEVVKQIKYNLAVAEACADEPNPMSPSRSEDKLSSPELVVERERAR